MVIPRLVRGEEDCHIVSVRIISAVPINLTLSTYIVVREYQFLP